MIVYVLGTVVLDISVKYWVLYLRTLAYEVGSVITYWLLTDGTTREWVVLSCVLLSRRTVGEVTAPSCVLLSCAMTLWVVTPGCALCTIVMGHTFYSLSFCAMCSSFVRFPGIVSTQIRAQRTMIKEGLPQPSCLHLSIVTCPFDQHNDVLQRISKNEHQNEEKLQRNDSPLNIVFYIRAWYVFYASNPPFLHISLFFMHLHWPPEHRTSKYRLFFHTVLLNTYLLPTTWLLNTEYLTTVLLHTDALIFNLLPTCIAILLTNVPATDLLTTALLFTDLPTTDLLPPSGIKSPTLIY